MLNFKTPDKDDIPLLRSYCENYGTMGCDCNPVNIFIWRNKYNIKICFTDGFLVTAYFKDENTPWGYSFPIGRGNPEQVIGKIFDDAKCRGCNAEFVMLTHAQKEKLVEITGYKFSFEELSDDEDYIYRNYDLSVLPGKKYHSKRNHISKFDRNFPDWHFEIMRKENFKDALAVMDKWCESRKIDVNSYEEYSAVTEVLDNYDLLKIHGGILYAGVTPVAMTMGSRINKNIFDTSFEKALVEYDGSYAKINNEFAKTLVGFEFINREEDMGIESLKKAKLSYHPVVVLKRFRGMIND